MSMIKRRFKISSDQVSSQEQSRITIKSSGPLTNPTIGRMGSSKRMLRITR